MSEKKRSGFEQIPGYEQYHQLCRDPSHFPPTHICIPQGMQYRHVCPGCGKELVIQAPLVTFGTSAVSDFWHVPN